MSSTAQAPRRGRAALMVAATVAISATTAWFVGAWNRLPEQRVGAVGTAPVSVPVEWRSMRTSQSGTLSVHTPKEAETPLGCPEAGVVTRFVRPAPGAELRTGQLLADVQGRPVIAVAGTFPLYRKLRLGDRGPDAALLNAALLGVADDPVVRAATLAAHAQIWAAAGYGVRKSIDPCEVTVVKPGAQFARFKGAVGAAAQETALVSVAGPARVEVRLARSAGPKPERRSRIVVGSGPERVAYRVSRVEARDGFWAAIATTTAAPSKEETVGVVESARGAGRLPTVPVSAIFTDADGRTTVSVMRKGAPATEAPRAVPVALRRRSDGWVQLAPTRALRRGAVVVVGTR